MTRDDIIRMAREAGWSEILLDLATEIDFGRFTRFAALVAAKEREACCKIVFGMAVSDNVAQRTVDAIMARGQE